MAKKLRTTKRKRNTKRKLRNTKRILGTKRYKGGGNIGENALKEKYKQMLKDINVNIIGGLKIVLKQPDSTLQSTRLGMFMDNIMLNIEQDTAEELKEKLLSVSKQFKTYETIPNSGYKTKALNMAKAINTELLK